MKNKSYKVANQSSKLILYANDSKKWNCILHFGGKGLNKKINVEEELTHIKDITRWNLEY